MKSWLKITVIVLLTIFPIPVLGVSNKHALIIGNSAYKDVPLKNPENDANDMASTLEQLGFTVLKKTNVDQQTIEQAFREFEQQLQTNDIALFYFSGHGIQIDGINYLLPIGADIYSADEIKYKAVNANMVLDKLQNAGTQLNIIILDACRNNPFKKFRSLERGLAIMSASTGTIISYATAPGSVAYDGDERNSPYTKYLLKTMLIPGLEVEKVFKQVRVAVMAATENKQVPWESSSLTGDFYFNSSLKQEYSLRVDAQAGWVDSGIDVSTGYAIQVSATGQWSNGSYTDGKNVWTPVYGPDGGNSLEGCSCPLRSDGVLVGTLIGRIDDHEPFRVGATFPKTFMKHSGRLYFTINDDLKTLPDNNGFVTLNITVFQSDK